MSLHKHPCFTCMNSFECRFIQVFALSPGCSRMPACVDCNASKIVNTKRPTKPKSEISSRSSRASADTTLLQTAKRRVPRLGTTEKRFPYRTVGTGNSLSVETRRCNWRKTFKRQTKSLLLSPRTYLGYYRYKTDNRTIILINKSAH